MNQQINEDTLTDNSTSSVDLSISCRNLLDKDLFSKSDPICVVYHKPIGVMEWLELVRTEVIWDNLNPDFVTKLEIEYRNEELSTELMKFEVYDVDDEKATSLVSNDSLGYAECTLGQIVTAGSSALTLPLSQGHGMERDTYGKIILLAEKLSHLREEVTIQIDGHAMGSRLCCFVPKIFFIIYKVNKSGRYSAIYRSESCRAENPRWKLLTLTMDRLCNGDKDRVLSFQCFREGANGYHTNRGNYLTTFNKLCTTARRAQIACLCEPNGNATGCWLVFRRLLLYRY